MEAKLGVWGVLERISKVAATLLIPVFLWGVGTELRLRDLPRQHENMELRLERLVDAKISGMDIPPEWFRQNVEEIKAQGKANSVQLTALALDVRTLKASLEALRPMLRDN